jgi:hypothetical protein
VLLTQFLGKLLVAMGLPAFQEDFRQRVAVALGVDVWRVIPGQTTVGADGQVIQELTLIGNGNREQGKLATAVELYDELMEQLSDSESAVQKDPILTTSAAAQTCPDGKVRASCDDVELLNSLNAGIIVAIIVAAIIFAFAICMAGLVIKRKRNERKAKKLKDMEWDTGSQEARPLPALTSALTPNDDARRSRRTSLPSRCDSESNVDVKRSRRTSTVPPSPRGSESNTDGKRSRRTSMVPPLRDSVRHSLQTSLGLPSRLPPSPSHDSPDLVTLYDGVQSRSRRMSVPNGVQSRRISAPTESEPVEWPAYSAPSEDW